MAIKRYNVNQTHTFKFIQPDLNEPAIIEYTGTITEALTKFHEENPGVKDWGVKTNARLPDRDVGYLNKF